MNTEVDRLLLDVNVLVAMFDMQHVHHERVTTWISERDNATLVSCPITEMGCLRVLSHTRAVPQLSITQIADQLAPFFDRCEHWPCDIRISNRKLFKREYIHGHRQLTDIYLLGLVTSRNGTFVTLDRAIPINAVRGASAQNLIVL